MAKVFISLGSNMENRYAFIQEAIERLRAVKEIDVTDISSVYETDPVGYVDQPSFLNLVVCIQTKLEPLELLSETQHIENHLGRKRDIKWGPRTIDLDILLYDQENMKVERLEIPHPRMWQRAFVIVPLMEVAPDLFIHSLDLSIKDVHKQLKDKEGVSEWKP
ncbi:2-amino-4-hydroxy-6-hydroxymethyldihydropteridine diphosphokinase [Alkalicoccobacillus murimartini]|uniref:2-amino-4-hydroxy-6-hydroxymethyldihydropteridine diphosphokinase n=1 Tax=Alkalicoccobacillus murimartini TaxID=171685 RepID=A0ABT9YNP3_9BACI|nr:2-amino-4-hydroxy-6-hydroxymethyldihydropteridine diphosphokinase [Alkalicoccobacillus murimartini]MDQ0209233.1 2-amino-4-hydroxy-6-hydroxymethyldihydropteridine diphosphokinase [Alkalicoccobacillus murimartini]